VTKSRPCVETEAVCSRRTEIGVDWCNSQEVCFLCRTLKTQDTERNCWGRGPGPGYCSVPRHIRDFSLHLFLASI